MRYAGTNRSFVGSFSIQRKKETFPIKRMKQNIVKMTPVLVFPSSREQKKTFLVNQQLITENVFHAPNTINAVLHAATLNMLFLLSCRRKTSY